MPRDPGTGRQCGLGSALAGFLCIRAIILAAALMAPQDRSRPGSPEYWSDLPLVRWDAGHYAYILQHGYPPGPPTSDTIAFFPGYPLVARPLARWLSPDLALVIASHLASLIGVLFLYAWSTRRSNPRAAFWCVLLLAAYPPAMFLSVGYADGLLFMCVAVTLWLLEHQRVFAAACVSALATATRPTGLAVAAIVVIWAWLHGRRGRRPRRALRLLLIGAVSVSGLVAFQAYLWRHCGQPDAFFAVQSNWAHKSEVRHPIVKILTLKPVLQPLLRPIKYIIRGQFSRLLEPTKVWNPLFNFLILLLAVKGLIRPRNIPRVLFLLPVFIFLMAYLPDPCRGGRLVGVARYQLAALPCFLLLADWVASRWSRLGRYGLLVAQIALQCLYVRGFVNWEMVG